MPSPLAVPLEKVASWAVYRYGNLEDVLVLGPARERAPAHPGAQGNA